MMLRVFIALSMVALAAAQCMTTFTASHTANDPNSFVVSSSGCSGLTYQLFSLNVSSASSFPKGNLATNINRTSSVCTSTQCTFDLRRNAVAGDFAQSGTFWWRLADGTGPFFGPFTTLCAPSTRGAETVDPPKFVPAGSIINATGGIPALILKFSLDAIYDAVGVEFLYNNTKTTTYCGQDFSKDFTKTVRGGTFAAQQQAGGKGSNGAWTLTGTSNVATGCSAKSTFEYEVTNYNNALTNCGWLRDESATGFTTFKTTVLITTLQQGVVIRNVRYETTLETAVQLGIQFLTNVSAVTNNIEVFGPQILYSTIVKQVFDPLSYCGYWGLLTSVQGPYQLFPLGAWSLTNTNGLGAITTRAMTNADLGTLKLTTNSAADYPGINAVPAGVDTTNPFAGSVANLAVCLTNTYAAATFAAQNTSASPYTPCNQLWYLSACGTCSGFGDTKTLQGNWTANFNVTCDNTFQGSCATPQNPTVQVQWVTSSDNYCPRIVDTESSSAVLTVYDTTNCGSGASQIIDVLNDGPAGCAFSRVQSQFVFGSRSYFEMRATSSININDFEVERITITSGAAATLLNGIVYNRPFNNSATWWQPIANYRNLVNASVVNSQGIQSTFRINKNVTSSFQTSTILERSAQFQWVWGSWYSAASGDDALQTIVRADGRIRFQDQANPKHLVLSATMMPSLQVDTYSASANVGVSETSSTTTSNIPTTTDSSSSSVFSTTNVAVGVAVAGGVALVAAGVVVRFVKRRASKEQDTNTESVMLSGGSSAVQLTAV